MTSGVQRAGRTSRAGRAGIALLATAGLLAVGLGVTSAQAVEPKIVVQDHEDSATALDVSWSDVKGAAAYRVRYSTDDDLKKSVETLPDVTKGTEATIDGLDTGESYYVQVIALDDKGSALGDSAVIRAAARYAYAAPGDVYATKVTNKQMTLSWKSVGDVGYLVEVSGRGKTHTMTTDKASVVVTNTKKKTDYTVKVRAAKGSEALSPNSPAQTFTSSGYAIAAPDHLREGKQAPKAYDLSWDEVDGLSSGQGYRVEYSKSTDFKRSGTTRTVAGTRTTVKGGLKVDMTYYTRMWVVDAKGKRISEMTDFVTAKTTVPRGTLAGDVSGPPSGDLMAVAYDKKGNAALQVPVSKGHYELAVRPSGNPYKVQILYVGNDVDASWASTFAHTKGTGWTISQGTKYDVDYAKTTKVADVAVKHGNTLKGTVTNGRSPIRDVDVTAISGQNPGKPKQERAIIAMVRTDKNGRFTMPGLPDGPYWFRYHYVGGGKSYKILSDHRSMPSKGVKVTLVRK